MVGASLSPLKECKVKEKKIPICKSPLRTLVLLKLHELLGTLLCVRDPDLLLFIVIEVARVTWPSALWYDGSLNLKTESSQSVSQTTPVHSLSEEISQQYDAWSHAFTT